MTAFERTMLKWGGGLTAVLVVSSVALEFATRPPPLQSPTSGPAPDQFAPRPPAASVASAPAPSFTPPPPSSPTMPLTPSPAPPSSSSPFETSLASALAIPDEATREGRLTELIQSGGEDAARNLFTTLRAQQERGEVAPGATEAFIKAWANVDPTSAITEAVFQLGPEAATSLVDQLAGRNLDAAASVLASLSQPDGMHGAFHSVADQLFNRNPQDAARWLTSLGESEPARAATYEFVERWAFSSPGEAGSWVSTNPDSFASRVGAGVVARVWTQNDAASAIDWSSTLPPQIAAEASDAAFNTWHEMLRSGSTTEAAIADVVARNAVRMAEAEPRAAVRWIQTVKGPAANPAIVTDVARTWFNQDPEGALHWIGATDLLPDGQRQALLAELQNR